MEPTAESPGGWVITFSPIRHAGPHSFLDAAIRPTGDGWIEGLRLRTDVDRELREHAAAHGYRVIHDEWHDILVTGRMEPIRILVTASLTRRDDGEWPAIWQAFFDDAATRALLKIAPAPDRDDL